MFCKYCGKEIPEGTAVCPYCNNQQAQQTAAFTPPPQQPPFVQNQPAPGFPPPAPQKPKTPELAIASLALGIGGIVLGCCIALLGLVMCIAGLALGITANKKEKTPIGTAGIIVSGVGIGLMIINMILGAAVMVSGYFADLF